jgi:hypothetical protein
MLQPQSGYEKPALLLNSASPVRHQVRQRSRQDKVHARCFSAVALSLALDGSLSHVFTTLAAGLLFSE